MPRVWKGRIPRERAESECVSSVNQPLVTKLGRKRNASDSISSIAGIDFVYYSRKRRRPAPLVEQTDAARDNSDERCKVVRHTRRHKDAHWFSEEPCDHKRTSKRKRKRMPGAGKNSSKGSSSATPQKGRPPVPDDDELQTEMSARKSPRRNPLRLRERTQPVIIARRSVIFPRFDMKQKMVTLSYVRTTPTYLSAPAVNVDFCFDANQRMRADFTRMRFLSCDSAVLPPCPLTIAMLGKAYNAVFSLNRLLHAVQIKTSGRLSECVAPQWSAELTAWSNFIFDAAASPYEVHDLNHQEVNQYVISLNDAESGHYCVKADPGALRLHEQDIDDLEFYARLHQYVTAHEQVLGVSRCSFMPVSLVDYEWTTDFFVYRSLDANYLRSGRVAVETSYMTDPHNVKRDVSSNGRLRAKYFAFPKLPDFSLYVNTDIDFDISLENDAGGAKSNLARVPCNVLDLLECDIALALLSRSTVDALVPDTVKQLKHISVSPRSASRACLSEEPPCRSSKRLSEKRQASERVKQLEMETARTLASLTEIRPDDVCPDDDSGFDGFLAWNCLGDDMLSLSSHIDKRKMRSGLSLSDLPRMWLKLNLRVASASTSELPALDCEEATNSAYDIASTYKLLCISDAFASRQTRKGGKEGLREKEFTDMMLIEPEGRTLASDVVSSDVSQSEWASKLSMLSLKKIHQNIALTARGPLMPENFLGEGTSSHLEKRLLKSNMPADVRLGPLKPLVIPYVAERDRKSYEDALQCRSKLLNQFYDDCTAILCACPFLQRFTCGGCITAHITYRDRYEPGMSQASVEYEDAVFLKLSGLSEVVQPSISENMRRLLFGSVTSSTIAECDDADISTCMSVSPEEVNEGRPLSPTTTVCSGRNMSQAVAQRSIIIEERADVRAMRTQEDWSSPSPSTGDEIRRPRTESPNDDAGRPESPLKSMLDKISAPLDVESTISNFIDRFGRQNGGNDEHVHQGRSVSTLKAADGVVSPSSSAITPADLSRSRFSVRQLLDAASSSEHALARADDHVRILDENFRHHVRMSQSMKDITLLLASFASVSVKTLQKRHMLTISCELEDIHPNHAMKMMKQEVFQMKLTKAHFRSVVSQQSENYRLRRTGAERRSNSRRSRRNRPDPADVALMEQRRSLEVTLRAQQHSFLHVLYLYLLSCLRYFLCHCGVIVATQFLYEARESQLFGQTLFRVGDIGADSLCAVFRAPLCRLVSIFQELQTDVRLNLIEDHMKLFAVTKLVYEYQREAHLRSIRRQAKARQDVSESREPAKPLLVLVEHVALVSVLNNVLGHMRNPNVKDTRRLNVMTIAVNVPLAAIDLLLDDCHVVVASVAAVWRSSDFPWRRVGAVLFYDVEPEMPPYAYVQELFRTGSLSVQSLCSIAKPAPTAGNFSLVSDTSFSSLSTAAEFPARFIADANFLQKYASSVTAFEEMSHATFVGRTLRNPVRAASNIRAGQRNSHILLGEDIILDNRTCLVVKQVHQLIERDPANGKLCVENWINELARLSLKFDKCYLLLICASEGASSLFRSVLSSPQLLQCQLMLATTLLSDLPLQVTSCFVPNADELPYFISMCVQATRRPRSRSASFRLDSVDSAKSWIREVLTPQERFLSSFPCINALTSQEMLYKCKLPSTVSGTRVQSLVSMSSPDLRSMLPSALPSSLRLFAKLCHDDFGGGLALNALENRRRMLAAQGSVPSREEADEALLNDVTPSLATVESDNRSNASASPPHSPTPLGDPFLSTSSERSVVTNAVSVPGRFQSREFVQPKNDVPQSGSPDGTWMETDAPGAARLSSSEYHPSPSLVTQMSLQRSLPENLTHHVQRQSQLQNWPGMWRQGYQQYQYHGMQRRQHTPSHPSPVPSFPMSRQSAWRTHHVSPLVPYYSRNHDHVLPLPSPVLSRSHLQVYRDELPRVPEFSPSCQSKPHSRVIHQMPRDSRRISRSPAHGGLSPVSPLHTRAPHAFAQRYHPYTYYR